MATAAEEIKDDELDPNADPNAEKAGEGGEEETNGEDSPYAPLAKEMGWVPKDQYKGDAEAWKPAEQFIRDGRDIQKETSRELKNVRQQLDTIAKTSATIVEQQVKERVQELSDLHQKAVDDGDPAAAFKIAKEITTLTTPHATGPSQSSDAQAFAERNKAWFNQPGNEYATARAVEICNTLASQGYDHATQLRIAEQRLQTEMPQLFGGGKNGKPAPGVHAPGSRTSGASNRAKGFSDMPAEAQKIARDMADRQVIKNAEQYVEIYWREQDAKAGK